MAEGLDQFRNTDLEDIEVNTQYCCRVVLKSNSSAEHKVHKNSPFSKPKDGSRDRGIKLTHYNSLNYLNKSAKQQTLQNETKQTAKTRELKIKKIYSSEAAEVSHERSSQKLMVTKKCLDFKNKVIIEHSLKASMNCKSQIHKEPSFSITPPLQAQPNLSPRPTINWRFSQSHESLYETPKISETILSIDKDTSRYTKESLNAYSRTPSHEPLLLSNHIDCQKMSIIVKQQPKEYNIKIHSLKLNKSQRKLQKIYERNSGRKMQVFQSQVSCQADLYSVAESFDWREQV